MIRSTLPAGYSKLTRSLGGNPEHGARVQRISRVARGRGAAAAPGWTVPRIVEDQVCKAIRSSLSRQDCSIEEVAVILSVAPRTLQRQLQQRGTSFSQLLEEVRASSARRHLTESQLTLTQLAAILGYSELSAYSRAFHRWHGQSPQQWQRSRNT